MCDAPSHPFEPTDAALVAAWRAGDQDAARRLFARYYAKVLRFHERRAPDEAHDLTQKTFTRCWEAQSRLPELRSFRAYVFRIADRLFIDHLRAKRRLLGKLTDTAVDTLLDVGVSPSQSAAASEASQRLAAALYALPIAWQTIFDLHYFGGLTVEEIAVVLETPSGTIRTRLQSGRKRLAALVEQAGGLGLTVDSCTIDAWLAELRHTS